MRELPKNWTTCMPLPLYPLREYYWELSRRFLDLSFALPLSYRCKKSENSVYKKNYKFLNFLKHGHNENLYLTCPFSSVNRVQSTVHQTIEFGLCTALTTRELALKSNFKCIAGRAVHRTKLISRTWGWAPLWVPSVCSPKKREKPELKFLTEYNHDIL
jgi:hypothetical protein